MPYVFPTHLFNPASVKADPVQSLISGGQSLSGEEDVIATDGGGRWLINYSGITLRTPELLRKWDAWTSHLGGGTQTVLVPLVSLKTAPRSVAGNSLARPSSIYSNDPYFPTEVRYAAPYIVAETVGNTALRATTMTLLVTQGARIQGGEKFSVNGRPNKIERVLSRPSEMSAVCRIQTPTRELIASGSAVEFGWPLARCKAAIGQDLAPDVAFGRIANVSISFVEDFSDAA